LRVTSRGLGDVYKRQHQIRAAKALDPSSNSMRDM
jgi:hypothetical protein